MLRSICGRVQDVMESYCGDAEFLATKQNTKD